MARPLQKKKNKSSLPRVRQKAKSKHINIRSDPIVAANWNPKLTLSQNYRRLGLSSRLNSHTGGTEVASIQNDEGSSQRRSSGLAIPSSKAPKALGTEEVRVVRDPKTGAIVSVQDGRKEKANRNPLGDPLNELSNSEDEDDGEDRDVGNEGGRRRGIVPELEEAAKYSKKKRPRQQSQGEREWIARLVERWGDDWGAMFRDRRLNPRQQTEGDLKRRVGLWKRSQGTRVEGVEVDGMED
ncbi:hypothetical protein N7G274_009156 [Stereocaulon virgatum]|uniref:Nucleolar protein 16 n=1 Tax=Stereocaulon virgatum TaxID=373712 RepID=A0ABR3ZZK5_9LECA